MARETVGVAAAVTDWAGAETVVVAGHANIAGTPLAPEHLFQIGSISKSFAAICALQLEREGVLSLDDELTKHLPWFRVGGGHGPIRLRHLLMHRSGLPAGSEAGPSSVAHVADLAGAETLWEPGTRFWYSNVGYDALGLALERRAGLPFPELVRRRILQPLGMHASSAHIAAGHRASLADGHERVAQDRPPYRSMLLETAPFVESEAASGSVLSTAGDMAAYVRLLLGRGAEGMLDPADFDQMTDGLPDDEGTPYGLGLSITGTEGHTVVGHTGSMVGYRANMLCDLDSGVGAVALVNGPKGARVLAEYALALARAAREGTALPDPPPDPQPDLVPYTGRYGPFTVTDSGIAGSGFDGGLEELGRDVFSTDHPELSETLVRFGRTNGRVDHLMAGDDWYPAEGYLGPAEFRHPPEWAAHPSLYRSHNPWLPACRVTLCRGELAVEEESYGRIPLAPRSAGGFLWATPEGPLPEVFRFDTLVDGRSQRLDWNGCVFYRAMQVQAG